MRTSETLLVQQNNHYTNLLKESEHKLQILQQDFNDQAAECQQAVDFISKQKHEIEGLKNENKELNNSKLLIQKELKLLKLQYEKLERAFIDSIEKIMNHKIVILDERDEMKERL